ncbi:hypothetical protein BZM27_21160 [Paraburkholderia steynii]|uniref:Uncharacterized protein n=1 Tax=Paraburkholderia steynii TaxID=1245441 RepID=A0A4R0XJ77_9BURK|nr:hypothetical protein BZM27_21160 [Paraburkholderia steynii]
MFTTWIRRELLVVAYHVKITRRGCLTNECPRRYYNASFRGQSMNDGKPQVTAHAPGGDGPLSDVARNLIEATGAACVAVIILDPAGNGSYSVAGPLEAQLPMPDVLEKVVHALRTQLMGSVQ